MSTIFTKIINKEIPADIVYEDEKILAFKDIHPKAKIHILIIPKKEIPTLDDIIGEEELIAYLMGKVPEIAKKMGLHNGYRVQINCKEAGGQEVYHLHLHLLGN